MKLIRSILWLVVFSLVLGCSQKAPRIYKPWIPSSCKTYLSYSKYNLSCYIVFCINRSNRFSIYSVNKVTKRYGQTCGQATGIPTLEYLDDGDDDSETCWFDKEEWEYYCLV